MYVHVCMHIDMYQRTHGNQFKIKLMKIYVAPCCLGMKRNKGKNIEGI